ncbi:MAG: SH3 domain-containing protein [Chloroflexota bacterium]
MRFTIRIPKKQLRTAGAIFVLGLVFIVIFTVESPSVSSAQATNPATCTQILTAAQQSLAACNGLDRDQVCYGNQTVAVEYQDPALKPAFGKAGDIVPLSALKSITTGPLVPDRHEWGIAALKAQVSGLSNTSAGQAVTFILYGNTTFTNTTNDSAATSPAVTAAANPAAPTCTATTTRTTYLRGAPGPNEEQLELLSPNDPVTLSGRVDDGQWVFSESQGKTGWLFKGNLKTTCDINTLNVIDPEVTLTAPAIRSFYFSTGVGAQATCNDLPSGGLFVQSNGGRQVTFTANGVTLNVGSSIVLRAIPNQTMTVSVIKGHVGVAANGVEREMSDGQGVVLALGGSNGLTVNGIPGPVQNMPSYVNDNQISLSSLCKVAGSVGLSVPCQMVWASSPPPTP